MVCSNPIELQNKTRDESKNTGLGPFISKDLDSNFNFTRIGSFFIQCNGNNLDSLQGQHCYHGTGTDTEQTTQPFIGCLFIQCNDQHPDSLMGLHYYTGTGIVQATQPSIRSLRLVQTRWDKGSNFIVKCLLPCLIILLPLIFIIQLL